MIRTSFYHRVAVVVVSLSLSMASSERMTRVVILYVVRFSRTAVEMHEKERYRRTNNMYRFNSCEVVPNANVQVEKTGISIIYIQVG